MKVIRKGREQKGWSTEAECTGGGNGDGGCGAKLLVEAADIYRTEAQSRDETEAFATFQCPECGVLTDLVGVKTPPRHLWERDRLRKPADWGVKR